MAYVGYVAEVERRCRGDVRRVLPCLRHYFRWRGLPDATLGERVRGRQVAPAPVLLTAEELDAVYEAFVAADERRVAARGPLDARGAPPRGRASGRASFYGVTDALVVGLAAYQGLARGEVERLAVGDVDVAAGVVRAPGTRERLAREIPLAGHQVLTWQGYLAPGGGRERAMAGALAYRAESGRAPLAGEGEAESWSSWLIPSAGSGAGRLQNQFTRLGGRVRAAGEACGVAARSLQHVRQSRIGVWVERVGLRRAQHLAGFRSVASAERYRRSDLDDVARELGEHHPLG